MPIEQIAQIIGALLILCAFILLQIKLLKATSVTYLLINFVGAGILTITATLAWQWGFIILEGIWALVALAGLVRLLGKRIAHSA